jgi:hypothetical protein
LNDADTTLTINDRQAVVLTTARVGYENAGCFWVSSAKFTGEAPRDCFGDGRIHLFIHFRNLIN